MKPGDDPLPLGTTAWRTGLRFSLILLLLIATSAVVGYFVLFRGPEDEFAAQTKRIEQLQNHLKQAPNDTEARMKLAAEYSDRNPDLALSQLKRIPDGSRESPAARRETARLLFISGDYPAAIEVFDQLWEQSQDNADLAALGAQIHVANRNVRTAQNLARRAVALRPDRSDLWLLLAEIYQKSNRDYLMLEPLLETLKRDPDNYQAHLLMAIASHSRGNLPESTQEAAWCHSRRPTDVRPIQVLAEIARDEGQFELAEQYVVAALKLDPRDVATRVVESDLLMFRRQPELAYNRLMEVRSEVTPSMVRYFGALERAAAAAGKLDEAKEIAKDLERLQDSTRPPASDKRSLRKSE